jgi:hypothetical protein
MQSCCSPTAASVTGGADGRIAIWSAHSVRPDTSLQDRTPVVVLGLFGEGSYPLYATSIAPAAINPTRRVAISTCLGGKSWVAGTTPDQVRGLSRA